MHPKSRPRLCTGTCFNFSVSAPRVFLCHQHISPLCSSSNQQFLILTLIKAHCIDFWVLSFWLDIHPIAIFLPSNGWSTQLTNKEPSTRPEETALHRFCGNQWCVQHEKFMELEKKFFKAPFFPFLPISRSISLQAASNKGNIWQGIFLGQRLLCPSTKYTQDKKFMHSVHLQYEVKQQTWWMILIIHHA